ncbi:hypothetical protein HQ545_01850, partial [Candidatus Woesearchaeota archaeon]|nr:hypothetical protein [Candidatus Woesearchaeota archaeon]
MPKKQQSKPAIGFFDLTGCQGCVLTFLFNEDELLDLVSHVDVKAFRFVKGDNAYKRLQIAFVEGLVASSDDLDKIKQIRQNADVLVALGACAYTGCVPAYRNFVDASKYAYLVYEKTKDIEDHPPTPISYHVSVDYTIPGCPPSKKQISSFIKDVLRGKKPYDYDRPVCFECRLKENDCLLGRGKMCFGPITRGGCDAICPSGKFECWGCRGPTPDADIELMIKLLEEKGFSKEHIRQRLRTFSGMLLETPELKTVRPKPFKQRLRPIIVRKSVKKQVVKKDSGVKGPVKKVDKKKVVKKKSVKKTAKNPVKKKSANKKSVNKKVVKKKAVRKKVVKKKVVKKKAVKKKAVKK